MNSDFERARNIYRSVRTIRIDSEPSTDVRDRLGLLTVIVGLREVAAFGFGEHDNEGQLRSLKDRLGNYGVFSQITCQVRPSSHEDLADITSKLVDVFDQVHAESYRTNSGRLLWAF